MIETKAAFARRLKINKSVVTRGGQRDRLVLTADGFVDVEKSLVRWRETRGTRDDVAARHAQNRGAEVLTDHPAQKNAPQAAVDPAATDATPEQPGDASAPDGVGARLRMATMREREAKAEQVAMEVDIKAGLLVERAEVEFILRDFGHTLRGLLEGLPDRLASEVAAKGGNVNAIHAALEQSASQVLDEISGYMQRRAQEALGA